MEYITAIIVCLIIGCVCGVALIMCMISDYIIDPILEWRSKK